MVVPTGHQLFDPVGLHDSMIQWKMYTTISVPFTLFGSSPSFFG
jgi:hypothetical protein